MLIRITNLVWAEVLISRLTIQYFRNIRYQTSVCFCFGNPREDTLLLLFERHMFSIQQTAMAEIILVSGKIMNLNNI